MTRADFLMAYHILRTHAPTVGMVLASKHPAIVAWLGNRAQLPPVRSALVAWRDAVAWHRNACKRRGWRMEALRDVAEQMRVNVKH